MAADDDGVGVAVVPTRSHWPKYPAKPLVVPHSPRLASSFLHGIGDELTLGAVDGALQGALD